MTAVRQRLAEKPNAKAIYKEAGLFVSVQSLLILYLLLLLLCLPTDGALRLSWVVIQSCTKALLSPQQQQPPQSAKQHWPLISSYYAQHEASAWWRFSMFSLRVKLRPRRQ